MSQYEIVSQQSELCIFRCAVSAAHFFAKIAVGYSINSSCKWWVRYWEDPSTVYDDRVVGEHYINVTEFVIDKIAQDKYMRIATWGGSYYLKYDAFMRNFGIGGSVFFYETK